MPAASFQLLPSPAMAELWVTEVGSRSCRRSDDILRHAACALGYPKRRLSVPHNYKSGGPKCAYTLVEVSRSVVSATSCHEDSVAMAELKLTRSCTVHKLDQGRFRQRTVLLTLYRDAATYYGNPNPSRTQSTKLKIKAASCLFYRLLVW